MPSSTAAQASTQPEIGCALSVPADCDACHAQCIQAADDAHKQSRAIEFEWRRPRPHPKVLPHHHQYRLGRAIFQRVHRLQQHTRAAHRVAQDRDNAWRRIAGGALPRWLRVASSQPFSNARCGGTVRSACTFTTAQEAVGVALSPRTHVSRFFRRTSTHRQTHKVL